MSRNHESRLASAFATLVCAWALGLVVLGLTVARPTPEPARTALVSATASR